MQIISDPKTRSALRKINCLAVEDRLDGKAFAVLLARRLEAEHIAETLEDVSTVETTAGQLVRALIGRVDEQVIELTKPLLSTGATGPVQEALSNGHVLCAGRAKIEVNIEGEKKVTSISTRFLTSDPDVLEHFAFEPRRKRVESMATNYRKMAELVEARQPAMAERVTSFIDQLSITWERALERAS